MYSHLRFVTAASLIAFAGLIGIGVPALLFFTGERPLVARVENSDPAATSCKQQDWLNFDPSCWSRRDLSGHDMPWTAGRAAPNVAKIEVASAAQKAAERPLTEVQHTATVAQESVPQASAPQEMAQASVPKASVPPESVSQESVP